MTLKTSIKNSYLYRIIINLYHIFSLWRGYRDWGTREYAAPSPYLIKQAILLRNGFPNAIWVETGTYLGITTKALSKHGSFVYSIEPEPTLYANAKKSFEAQPNVEIINGISEDIFPKLLPKLSGVINFWLDGHYSGGETFAGPNDCPLFEELTFISQNIRHFEAVSILIDDIRLCGKTHVYGAYPSLEDLVDFAKSNNLDWHIEHDIFVAKTKQNPPQP
jgi:hypothetical protein